MASCCLDALPIPTLVTRRCSGDSRCRDRFHCLPHTFGRGSMILARPSLTFRLSAGDQRTTAAKVKHVLQACLPRPPVDTSSARWLGATSEIYICRRHWIATLLHAK